jgi:hypothetical protein
MHGISTGTGHQVGYDMAEYWLNRANYVNSGRWLAFAKAHDANQPCGPEITEALNDILSTIARHYINLDPAQKEMSCCTVFDLTKPGHNGPELNDSAARAWDITDLYMLSRRGFKEPSRSVRVSGKCYDAAAVNYVAFGLMAKLCGKSCSFAVERTRRWKRIRYSTEVDPETEAWIRAGHRGWSSTFSDVYSFTPYTTTDDPNRKTIRTMVFTWLPYWYQGKPAPAGGR